MIGTSTGGIILLYLLYLFFCVISHSIIMGVDELNYKYYTKLGIHRKKEMRVKARCLFWRDKGRRKTLCINSFIYYLINLSIYLGITVLFIWTLLVKEELYFWFSGGISLCYGFYLSLTDHYTKVQVNGAIKRLAQANTIK